MDASVEQQLLSEKQILLKEHSEKVILNVLDYGESIKYCDALLMAAVSLQDASHSGNGVPLETAQSSFSINLIVLASWSSLVHRVLKELDLSAVDPVIILDGFDHAAVKEFLALMYTGRIDGGRHRNGAAASDVLELLRVLQVRDGTERFHLLGVERHRTGEITNHERSLCNALDQGIKQEISSKEHAIDLLNNFSRDVLKEIQKEMKANRKQGRILNSSHKNGDNDLSNNLRPNSTLTKRQSTRKRKRSEPRAFINRESEIASGYTENSNDYSDENLSNREPKVEEIAESENIVPHLQENNAQLATANVSTPARDRENICTLVDSPSISDDGNGVAVEKSDVVKKCRPGRPRGKKQSDVTAREVKCLQCEKVFVNVRRLKKHVRNTHSNEPAECDVCFKQFKSRHHLHGHKTRTHSTDVLQCDVCQKIYKHKTDLNKHKLSHLEIRKYTCRYCSKGFNRKDRYELHEKTHSGLTWDCSNCKKQFIHKAGFEKHCCGGKPKPYSCEVCGKGFMTKEMIQQHANSHTGEKLYNCEVCPKSFCYERSYHLHMQIHLGKKTAVCEICGKGFLLQSSLNVHKLTHTGDTRPKKFQCAQSQCTLSFHSNHNLQKHMRTHTGEKPFRCVTCGKSFGSKSCLDRHILRHTDERRYSCLSCPKKFVTAKGLAEHGRMHSGEKPLISCSICSMSFSTTNLLFIHNKTHHQQQQQQEQRERDLLQYTFRSGPFASHI